MQGYGKRILIIDDAEDIRYLTSLALNDAGYNTYSASDGAEGLDAMRKRRYDVVLV
ncbi:MAG: response regulator, partial [Nitrospira sp.]